MNGPGRDSGLPSSSRLDPSAPFATLPSRGPAEPPPVETMEGMLCRKQEMESHSKKAASRCSVGRGGCTLGGGVSYERKGCVLREALWGGVYPSRGCVEGACPMYKGGVSLGRPVGRGVACVARRS